MNKRSAMTVAAGLVLAMIVAGVALATGLTGPDSDSGTTVAVPSQEQDPIVRTVTRTIKVHETGAPTVAGQAPVIVRSSDGDGTAPSSDDPQSQQDEYEDDQYEDDQYEDDQYEDDDAEGEEDEEEDEEGEDD